MNKEFILCAANWYDDGIEHIHQCKNIKTGFVVCGRRHHNCIAIFAIMVGFPYDEKGEQLMRTEQQGFITITNTNRWVDRLEALKIAKEANQLITDKVNEVIGLYSEDLY